MTLPTNSAGRATELASWLLIIAKATRLGPSDRTDLRRSADLLDSQARDLATRKADQIAMAREIGALMADIARKDEALRKMIEAKACACEASSGCKLAIAADIAREALGAGQKEARREQSL